MFKRYPNWKHVKLYEKVDIFQIKIGKYSTYDDFKETSIDASLAFFYKKQLKLALIDMQLYLQQLNYVHFCNKEQLCLNCRSQRIQKEGLANKKELG